MIIIGDNIVVSSGGLNINKNKKFPIQNIFEICTDNEEPCTHCKPEIVERHRENPGDTAFCIKLESSKTYSFIKDRKTGQDFLKTLKIAKQNLSEETSEEKWLLKNFKLSDKDHDNKLNLREMMHFFHSINLQMSRTRVKELLEKYDYDHSHSISYEELEKWFEGGILLHEKTKEIFRDISGLDQTVDIKKFKEVLSKSQFHEMYLDLPREITKYDFANFISSANILGKTCDEFQDMTHPITDYWIASSLGITIMKILFVT